MVDNEFHVRSRIKFDIQEPIPWQELHAQASLLWLKLAVGSADQRARS